MDLFSKLYQDVQDQGPLFDDTPRTSLFKTIEYKISTIVEMIDHIDSLSDDDLKGIIVRQHQMILNYDLFLSKQDSRKSALKLFTNVRFLKIFLDIIGTIPLTREEVVCINKLAYDYYILDNKNKEIADLLLSICYLINNKMVIQLSAKMNTNASRILSMISNSSFKIEKIVHRVNVFLMRYEDVDLSVQDYIYIYLIIFEHFKDLFVYSMLESWNSPINDPLLERQYKRYQRMSQALLAMLDSMTSEDIRTVLRNYGYTLLLTAPNTPVRFYIHGLKGYDRILHITENIELNESDIRIP